MPIDRWIASAAGGTSHRLNPGAATMRSLDRIDTSAVDPLAVRVDVEGARARKADERHAAVAREIDRKARRRRHRRDDRNSREDRLLHNLVRRAAAHAQEAILQRQRLAHQHDADDLVYGIVPADVVRDIDQSSIWCK